MQVWKEVPSWFNLDKYNELKNFDISKWRREILQRQINYEVLMNTEGVEYIDSTKLIELKTKAINFFDGIKKFGLSNLITSDTDKNLEFYLKIKYLKKFEKLAVQSLSELDAYYLYFDADNQEEIASNIEKLEDFTLSNLSIKLKERLEIMEKYSSPITKEFENRAFLEVDLNASNELIIDEFKEWLLEQRSDSAEFVNKKFSQNDFDDWIFSHVIPYWDLTHISKIENATIPYHVIGQALYPNEYGVDITERVRKVTKKKCNYLFSNTVIGALIIQARKAKAE